MKAWIRGAAAVTALVAATAAVVVGSGGSSSAAPPRLQAFGITSGLSPQLMVSFWTDQPDVSNWVQTVRGLPTNASLVGIDFRVQDGQLYALDNTGGIYVIAIPPVVTQPVVATKVSQLTVALSGTSFGVDFNPAADRLRVISDTGQNLRHNLNDHTTIVDGVLNPPTPARGVTAAAYTNNDLNSVTATALFDIDTNNDTVVIQSPPNNGSLAATGSLGFDVGLNAGFDIFSSLSSGKTVTNTGFATLTSSAGGSPQFYTVDLLTATATSVGTFPLSVTDIAVSLTSA